MPAFDTVHDLITIQLSEKEYLDLLGLSCLPSTVKTTVSMQIQKNSQHIQYSNSYWLAHDLKMIKIDSQLWNHYAFGSGNTLFNTGKDINRASPISAETSFSSI